MDIIPLPGGSPGQFQVLLGGKALSCYNDTDCPGAAICAVNQTWGAGPHGNCMCNTQAGLGGAQCNVPCENGIRIILLGLCILIGSFIGIVAGTFALYNLAKIKDERKLNPVTMVLFCSTVGSYFYFILMTANLVSSVGFANAYIIIPDPAGSGRIIKSTTQSTIIASSVGAGLGTCIGLDALIFLPLYWYDLASRIVKLRQRITTTLYSFSFLIFLLITGVQFPLIMVASMGYYAQQVVVFPIVNILWNVPFAAIIFLNLIAIWKMQQLRKFRKDIGQDLVQVTTASSPSPGTGSTPKHISTTTTSNAKHISVRDNDKFDDIINRIQFTASIIALLAVGMAVGISQSYVRLFRTPYSDPFCNVAGDPFAESDFSLQFAIFLMQVAMCMTIWFVFAGVKSKLISAKSKMGSSALSSVAGGVGGNKQ